MNSIRKFKLAVASIDIEDVENNLLKAIENAGRHKVDLLVLPETPDLLMKMPCGKYTFKNHPLYKRIRSAACKAKIAVTMSLTVNIHAEDKYANMGFLLNPRGEIIGLYNKKHLCPSENIITEPIETEDPFPVFNYKGINIALAICMDIHFPEMFRIYSLKKADIVCILCMYYDYTGDMLESLEKARAIDNQIYLGLSRYIALPYLAGKQMGYAKVIAPDGRIIASTGHQPGIAIAEFDPRWKMPTWYAEDILKKYPDFKSFEQLRKPEFYSKLTEGCKEK